jgi:hypothetical protein
MPPISDIATKLLQVRQRRGGGYSSYFGGDASALETAVADILSARGTSAREGVLNALEMGEDVFRALIAPSAGALTAPGCIGNWGDDEEIEMWWDGSNGFGSEFPNIAMMSDFRRGSPGQNLILDDCHHGLWIPHSSAPLQYYDDGDDVCVVGYNQANMRPRANEFEFSQSDKIFASYWMKYPTGSRTPGAVYAGNNTPANVIAPGSHQKPLWIHSRADADGDTTGSSDGPDLCLPTYNNGWYVAGNEGPSMFSEQFATTSQFNANNVWNRFAFHMTQGRACFAQLMNTVAGIVVHNTNFLDPGPSSEPGDRPVSSQMFNTVNPKYFEAARLAGWFRWDTPSCYPLFHHLYFATGPGCFTRVEVGDSPVYASCKQLSICDITTGDNTRVRFRARRDAHPTFRGKHAFFFRDSTRAPVPYFGAESRPITLAA